MAKCRTDYLDLAFNGKYLKLLTRRAKTQLDRADILFDAIAFRGVSGALVAPGIAAKMNKGLIVVRKPGEDRHSPYEVEGMETDSYIIVDDFINTGETIKVIQAAVKTFCPRAKCRALILWKRPSKWSFDVDGDTYQDIPVFRLKRPKDNNNFNARE